MVNALLEQTMKQMTVSGGSACPYFLGTQVLWMPQNTTGYLTSIARRDLCAIQCGRESNGEFPMAQDIRHPSQPRSVAEVLTSVDEMVRSGAAQELIPFPTNFTPLDQVLAGGLRPGDMMPVGG